LPFKFNLQRYAEDRVAALHTAHVAALEDEVGLHKFVNTVDPELETAWFQPLIL
jgi:hypothetical protein